VRHALLLAISLVLSLPLSTAEETIRDSRGIPSTSGTAPACPSALSAVLVSGAIHLTWDHPYNLTRRADEDALFHIYRAEGDFTIVEDDEGKITLWSYPQFVLRQSVDATSQEDYWDIGGTPGATYTYFVTYEDAVEVDRCDYVRRDFPILGAMALEPEMMRADVPGIAAAATLLLAAASALLMARRS